MAWPTGNTPQLCKPSYMLVNAFTQGSLGLLSSDNSTEGSTASTAPVLYSQRNGSLWGSHDEPSAQFWQALADLKLESHLLLSGHWTYACPSNNAIIETHAMKSSHNDFVNYSRQGLR